ncbi:hypothetical protein C5167_027621 [Papaver somniferum]|nr:hypothetical protein C5167_027621 [Papaver somniferum]
MADSSCIKRLQKEYRALCKEPVSHIVARPSPSDILEWRELFLSLPKTVEDWKANSWKKILIYVFIVVIILLPIVLEGSEGTPFAGILPGKIKFPPEYPFKPPGISWMNTERTFYHSKKYACPGDFIQRVGNPMWSVKVCIHNYELFCNVLVLYHALVFEASTITILLRELICLVSLMQYAHRTSVIHGEFIPAYNLLLFVSQGSF